MFGNIIKQQRQARELSQQKLADELNKHYKIPNRKGISKSMISRWENNKNDISMDYVRIIADYFNLNSNDIVGNTSSNIGRQIKFLRSKFGLSQPQLADKLGVSKQTISNWETNLKSPHMGALQKMSDLFNVSIGYITDAQPESPDMLQKIREVSAQLNDKRQQNVYKFAVDQLKSQSNNNIDVSFINLQARKNDFNDDAETREIVSGRDTAAGLPINGDDQDANVSKTIISKRDVPSSADEIVTVAGDSMEPEFPQYSQIFVHWQPTVDDGDLALVHVEDEGVTFKQILFDVANKKIILHSLNPTYEDRELDADDIHVIGKVISE